MREVTTHVRFYVGVLPLLDEICGETGENRPETLRRVLCFARKEADAYRQRKKYQDVIDRWGEPGRGTVT